MSKVAVIHMHSVEAYRRDTPWLRLARNLDCFMHSMRVLCVPEILLIAIDKSFFKKSPDHANEFELQRCSPC